MSKAILSMKYPVFAEALRERGYDIIQSQKVGNFIPYEQCHADMQCLIIEDTAFILSCCKRLIKALEGSYNVVLCGEYITAKYPENVVLNAAVIGKSVICKKESLDNKVAEFCEKRGYNLINVRQGYAKCSCAQVSDKAIITADKGIHKTLLSSDIDTLPIGEGNILLEGTEYGFIGGASGYDKETRTLYFCGNIKKHPDYDKIKIFCEKHGTRIISLSENELTDIGGIIIC